MACFSCVKKTSSKGNASEYKIAYNVLADAEQDNYEIYVMNSDGTEQKNLSQRPGVDWVYYAYEDRLYFISDRDSTSRNYFLYEMKWDGTEVRKITNFLVHDSWMDSRSGGTEFIISRNLDNDYDTRDLFIIDKSGEVISQITDDDFLNTDAQFSPDGDQIVFRSNRNGKGYSELFTMKTDGTDLRQLTFYPDDDNSAMDWEYHAGPPQWVSDTTISYISKQGGNYSIFKINPESGLTYQITPDTTSEGFPANEGWHSWSSDGNKIVYNATNWKGNYDIYIMNSDGTDPRRLTENPFYEQAPVFVYPEY